MNARLVIVLLLVSLFSAHTSLAASFEEAQKIKVEQLRTAAAHAVAQQRTESLPPQPLKADYSGAGGVRVEESSEWDADGDGKCLKVHLADIPESYAHTGIKDRLIVRFPKPVNLLDKATGLAFWVKTPKGQSADLRFGVYFKIQGTKEDPVVISDTPLVHKFGDNPHLAYIDWGYVFDHTVGVFKVPPREFFTKCTAVELTFVQKRLPRAEVKLAPASGFFYLDGLSLADFYDGTYDNSRFPKGKPINAADPIVSQGRTQQVARICAEFGGDDGAKSAIRAMDMMARIQCWDGSWPEMRTRLQGEWTHGMILADLAWALKALREQKRPELKEIVAVRHWKMPRDKLYEQMVYRGARSRSPAPISSYRDTYNTGKGALLSGCNRPMYFIVSQYVAAQVMTDPARKKAILAEYDTNMDDLVAHQGATAGGWPIFGEGDRYNDKGLHWDCSYTTDHVVIMTAGSRVTGDERWGKILKKFDTVVQAMVLANGYEIDGGLSERGGASKGGLKAPDMAFQEASRWGATALAQWGANASERVWSKWPRGGSLWPNCSSFRGYALGAFLTWQVYDMQAEPAPKDLGHVFPRQWPVWTARWMDKQGKEARRSKLIATPAGQLINTFKWEVGQYPVLSAVPLALAVEGDTAVEIEPIAYEGSTAGLPETPALKVVIHPGKSTEPKVQAVAGESFTVNVSEPMSVGVLSGHDKDFRVEFRAVPRKKGAAAKLTCRLLRRPVAYEHLYAQEQAADVDLDRPGANLADPATGTKVVPIRCFPSGSFAIERAMDDNPGTAWVIGQFKPGTGLRFEFPRELRLAKLVLSQGDWKSTFHLARKLTVALSDGTTKTIALEKKPGVNVETDLGGAKAKSLTLTVDEIYEVEGNKGNVGGWMELKILTAGKE
ncbi:MAG TPA: hypothetical protein VNA25_01965 [Phycisphaerae bacterium]|nr:hypothetical protein [Phycisphaerae bacterium]